MREMLVALGFDQWVLPALIAWPVIAAVLVRLGGRDISRDESGAEAPSGGPDARALTLAALGVEALLALSLWLVFDPDGRGWQAAVNIPWLPELGATISLGVDGISLPLVLLVGFVVPLGFLGSWDNVKVRTPAFGALLLLLTAGLMGVFVTTDLLTFYLSWELMLIPSYLLVGVWGTGNSSRAALRFVLFTLAGSLLLLVAIVALWVAGGGVSFQLDALLQTPLSPTAQFWMFGAFFVAFTVKSALVPVHTWLPDAQQSAPTIAAITLGIKVGGYGLLRFAIPLFPAAATHSGLRGGIVVLAVIATLYGALVALAQTDVKRVISYSSVSHFGIIVLGCFMLTPQSVQGAVMGIVSSGIATTALFVLAGMLEDRRGSTAFVSFGGIAKVVPWFSTAMVIALLSTFALPGTVGFIGEFLVLIGTFGEYPVLAIVATSGVVLAAAYGLRLAQRLLYGPLDSTTNGTLKDLIGRERFVMVALVVGIVALGVTPDVILRRTGRATQTLIESVRFGPNAPITLPPVSQSR